MAGNDLAVAYVQMLPSFDKFYARLRSEAAKSATDFDKYGQQAGTAWTKGFTKTAKSTPTATPVAGGGSGASAAAAATAAGVGAELGGVEAQAGLAGAAVGQSFAQGLASKSSAISAAGTALTAGISVPLGAAVVFSTKAALDFESAFAGVRKTVDASDAEFAQLAQSIRDMANEVPVSREEIAKIVELGGQFGLPNADLMQFAETVSQLGVATNLTTEDAALMLAQFAAVTGMPTDEFDDLGATIAALGNNMATQEDRIVQFMLRLGGQGRLIGLTTDEIAAFSAALASVGIMPEAGGTAFSRVFQRISDSVQTSNEDLGEFAEVAGMTAKQFQELYKSDPAELIQRFLKGLGQLAKSGSTSPLLEELSLIDVRIRDAVQRISGSDVLEKALDIGKNRPDTALVDEAIKRYGTAESKLQLFKNQLSDVGVEIGNGLLPTVTGVLEASRPLIDTLSAMASWFGKLPEPIKATAVGLTAVAIAAGPIAAILGRVGTAYSTVAKYAEQSRAATAANNAAIAESNAANAGSGLSKFTGGASAAATSARALQIAAKGAAGALALFTISETVFGFINDNTGVVKEFTEELNRLAEATKKGGKVEIDLSALVAAEQNTLRFQNLWQEFGAEVNFGDGVQADVEQAQRAIDALVLESPEAALRGLDSLQRVTDELPRNSDQYRRNTEFINRNRRAIEASIEANKSNDDSQEKVAASIGGTADSYRAAGDGAARLSAQMERLNALAVFNSGSFDSAAAAAEGYRKAVENATNSDDLISASISTSQGFRELLGGDGPQESKLASEALNSAVSVGSLDNALRSLNPQLAILRVNTDAATAASSAFKKSIEDSSSLDNTIGAVVSLGDAYRTWRKSVRALPAELNFAAVTLGKLKPRQERAVQGALSLGSATKDYLATLIEGGSTSAQVTAEADRLRNAYIEQFRQLGLNEDQIRRYLEAMGLTPEQVSTAIELSGLEESRAKLDAYLQLLDGRIPDSLSSTIVAKIEGGDIEGAADLLAQLAATNPVRIGVDLDSQSVATARGSLDGLEKDILDLPAAYDAVKVALGGYTEEQERGLQALISTGDSAQSVIAGLINQGVRTGDLGFGAARAAADQFQDKFREIISSLTGLDPRSPQVEAYIDDLLQLSDADVQTNIELAGVDAALAKLNLFKGVLEKFDTFSLADQLDIATALATGDYAKANGIIDREVADARATLQVDAETFGATESLKVWRLNEEGNKVLVPVDADPSLGRKTMGEWVLDETGNAVFVEADANTDPASMSIGEWRLDAAGNPVLMPTWADVGEADIIRDNWKWRTEHPDMPTNIPVGANTNAATAAVQIWRDNVSKQPLTIWVDVQAVNRQIQLSGGVPYRNEVLETVSGVDINRNGTIGRASGGYIYGDGGPTADRVPAMLSAGEYVMRAGAVRSLGVDFLDKLNKGYVPGFAMGGLVDSQLTTPAISTGGVNIDYTVVESKSNPTPEDLLRVTRSAIFLGSAR